MNLSDIINLSERRKSRLAPLNWRTILPYADEDEETSPPEYEARTPVGDYTVGPAYPFDEGWCVSIRFRKNRKIVTICCLCPTSEMAKAIAEYHHASIQ